MNDNVYKLKMYILIKDSVPDNMAPVIAAHASLISYLNNKDDPTFKSWLEYSFKKVVCKVNDKEWDNAVKLDGCSILSESSLDNKEVVAVFRPRFQWPKGFKYYTMWKTSQ